MADEGQCPTCGRHAIDWSKPGTRLAAGPSSKGRQHPSTEDRAAKYRTWRFGLGNGLYASDVDYVEWRIINGEPTPVATLELSRFDGTMPLPATYLKAVLARFGQRDAQGKVARKIAALLGVSCFIVLFRDDLGEFWVYNLSEGRGWWQLQQSAYTRWLRSLGAGEEQAA